MHAVDPSGNVAAETFEITQAGASRNFTYDANGNLTADGTRTFEWDARNQLVAVTVGTQRSEFVYNGAGQRVRSVLRENGVIQTDIHSVWCDGEVCEERLVSGATTGRFSRGEVTAGEKRFFAADHLGSVREVIDPAGTLLARYAFDPWGRMTGSFGSESLSTRGFAGFRSGQATGTWLAQYRGYDPVLGRWISEDPSGFVDGPNLFSYVTNRPLTHIDPAGLQGAMVTDPKVVRTPNLPGRCPPTACGCTIFQGDAGYSCSCVQGGYQLNLWAFFSATIYVNTERLTPEWLIESHERGHVDDYVKTTTWFLNRSGGIYPTLAACERAGSGFVKQMYERLATQRLRRHNFFAKLLCQ